MEEALTKHLEFIHNVINRMSNNSFVTRGDIVPLGIASQLTLATTCQ